MKATIVWIHTDSNGLYIVPPIMPGTEFYQSKTSLDALHYAQGQAELYLEKTGRVKFPSLAGSDFYLPRAKVELGEKARDRLGISESHSTTYGRNIFDFPVYNLLYLKSSPMAMHGVWFGTVFRNGEWASICTTETRSTIVPEGMIWSNLRVMKMKEAMHFPENPYTKKPSSKPDPRLGAFYSGFPEVSQDAMTALTKAVKQLGASMVEASDGLQRSTLSGRFYSSPEARRWLYSSPPSMHRIEETIEENPVTGELRVSQRILDEPVWYNTPAPENGGRIVDLPIARDTIEEPQSALWTPLRNDNPHGLRPLPIRDWDGEASASVEEDDNEDE